MPLILLDVPVSRAHVWDALEDAQRALVIDVLARLLVKAAVAQALEDPDDE